MDSTASQLLNMASACILAEPNIKSILRGVEPTPAQLIYSLAVECCQKDPEFVFKLALYLRDDLNIRTTANFLFAVAAIHPLAGSYVPKYYDKFIRLPTDWMHVSLFAECLHHKGSIPRKLRNCMVTKFANFNEFTLSKYKNKILTETGRDGERKTGVKRLIRLLHIGEKAPLVLGTLGKKYPDSLEAFRSMGLDVDGEDWDASLADSRMKLTIPITWETQVSGSGNVAEVWHALLDKKGGLPFMALLRNLRNIILANVDEAHHNVVLRRLTDEREVANSRQFPFAFLSAFTVLREQLDMKKAEDTVNSLEAKLKNAPSFDTLRKADGQKGKGQKGKGQKGKGQKKGKGPPSDDPVSEHKTARAQYRLARDKLSKLSVVHSTTDLSALLTKYDRALNTAVKIATAINLDPIPGRSIIFCDVSDTFNAQPVGGRQKSLAVTSLLDVALLLACMFRYACENASIVLFNSSRGGHQVIPHDAMDVGDLLGSVSKLKDFSFQGNEHFPLSYITTTLQNRVPLENIVVLSDSYIGMTLPSDGPASLPGVLHKYRRLLSPDLLFVSVNFSGAKKPEEMAFRKTISSPSGKTPVWWDANDPKNVFISGFSDSILRFVSTRGGNAQLEYVQHIDIAKKLPHIDIGAAVSYASALPPLPTLPRILTKPPQLKVFVSSTFIDFDAERTAVQEIFPVIKNVLARIDDHRLPQEISVVDLRWGVTSDCSALERCLRELSQCPVVIGFIGARYGHQVAKQDLTSLPDLDCFAHLRDRDDVSITEIELLQALKQQCHVNCYLRDKNFGGEFGWIDENPKLDQLRQFLLEKNVVRLHNYRPRIRGTSVVVSRGFQAQLIADVLASIFRHCGVLPPEDICDLIASANNVIPRAAKSVELEHVLPPWLITLRNNSPEQAHAFQRFLTPVFRLNVDRPANALLAQFLATKLWEDKKQIFALVSPPGYGKGWLLETLVAPEGVLLLKSTTTGGLDDLLRTLCLQLWALGVGDQPWALAEDELPLCLTNGLRVAAEGGKRILLTLNHPCIKNAEWIPQNAAWPASVKALVSLDVSQRQFQSRDAADEIMRGDHIVLDEKWSSRKPGLLSLSEMNKTNSIELLNAVTARLGKKLTEGQQRKIVAKREANVPLYVFVLSKVLCNASFSSLETLLTNASGILSELVLAQKPHQLATKIILAESVSLEILHGVLRSEINNFSHADFADILLSLAPIVDSSSSTLCFHPFVHQILLKNLANTLPTAHLALAQYFATHSLGALTSEVDGITRVLGANTCPSSTLVFHVVHAANVPLRDMLLALCHHVVCRPDFVQLRITQDGGVTRLLRDMALLLPHFPQSTAKGKVLREWRGFIMEKRSFLDMSFPQLCATMPSNHAVFLSLSNKPRLQPEIFELFANSVEGTHSQYSTFTWLNKPNSLSACLATNVAPNKSITSGDNIFAVANFRWEVRLYDNELTEIGRPLVHEGDVRCMAFNADCSKLAVGLSDHTCVIWDVSSGVCEQILKKHLKGVNSVDWLPLSGGTYVITGGDDRKIGVWDLALEYPHVGFLLGHDGPVVSVSCALASGMLASGSWDNTVRVWDLSELKVRRDFKTLSTIGRKCSVFKGHSQSIRAVSFKNRMKHVLSCSTDGTCCIWEPCSKTTVMTVSVWPAEATSCSLAVDNNVFSLGTSDRSLFVYRAATGTQLLLSLPGHGDAVVDSIVQPGDDPNDYKLLSVSHDRLKLWSAHIPIKTATMHGKTVGQDDLDADGTVRIAHSCPVVVLMRYAGDIVSVGSDGSAARWSSQGKLMWNRDCDKSIMGVRCGVPMGTGQGFGVFGPFGHRHFDDRGIREDKPNSSHFCKQLSTKVLCGAADLQAESYIVGTFCGKVAFYQRGERLPQDWISKIVLNAHDDWISSVAMHDNGCLALSGSYDRRVTVFSRTNLLDVWTTARVVASFADWIVQVAFQEDRAVCVSENVVVDLEHTILLDAEEVLVGCAFGTNLMALGASGRVYHAKGSLVVRNAPGLRILAVDKHVCAVSDLCGGVVFAKGASANYVVPHAPLQKSAEMGQISILRKALEAELSSQEKSVEILDDPEDNDGSICESGSGSWEESQVRPLQRLRRKQALHAKGTPEIVFGLHLW